MCSTHFVSKRNCACSTYTVADPEQLQNYSGWNSAAGGIAIRIHQGCGDQINSYIYPGHLPLFRGLFLPNGVEVHKWRKVLMGFFQC